MSDVEKKSWPVPSRPFFRLQTENADIFIAATLAYNYLVNCYVELCNSMGHPKLLSATSSTDTE